MARWPKIRASLVYCGRCGKRYTNPLTHVCRIRRAAGRARIRPQASLTCPRCGKTYANPLTHVCASRPGDFKRRKAAAARRERREQIRRRKAEAAARRAQASGSQHRYETCRDQDCRRLGCRAYREGFANGYAAAEAVAAAHAR